MKHVIKIFLATLLLLIPVGALAATAVPWSITTPATTFIFPNLVNNVAKGILLSASSTINGAFSVSGLTSGNCVQASTGGRLTTTGSACGSGTGSTFGTTSLSAVAPLQYSQSPLAQFSITKSGISGDGYLSSTDFNTFNNKVSSTSLSVTTTGTSGAATYTPSTGVFNIPQYQAAGTYVTSIAVATANGLAGSSSGGATPTLTLSTNVTGVVKANGTAFSAAANGTDYTLITANTCGAGQFFNSATAAGVLGCGTPAGTTYTGTFPIVVTGSVISSLFSTTTNSGMVAGNLYVGSGGLFQTSGTSTPTVSAPITYSGTLGQFASGVSGTFGCTNASAGVTGCLTGTDWSTFNNKQPAIALGAGTINSSASNALYTTATTSLSVGSPLTVTGTLGALVGGTNSTINCQTASGSQAGCLASADFTTFNNKQAAGNYITALTGDVTATGPNSVAATLATVNGNVGSFTNANITVNGKGLITAASSGSASAAYPFTPSTFGTLSVSATSTAIVDFQGLVTATSTIGTLVASSSITNQSVKNALVLNGATGLEGAYAGGNCTANQFATAITAVGGCTSAAVTGAFFGNVAANTVFGNFTGASAVPTFTATSSLFAGITGQSAYFASSGGLVGTSSLFFATNSNIGIGTTTPPSNYQTEIASANNQQLVLSDANTVDNQWAFRNAGGTLFIGTSSPTTYATSTTQSAIQVTSSATTLFGIGTSTPWRTLSVTGTVSFQNLTTSVAAQAGTLCLSSANEVLNESVACGSSALRYKQNIVNDSPTKDLEEILQLQPVTYLFKPNFNGTLQNNPNYSRQQLGLIADAAIKVNPGFGKVETATTTFEGVTYAPGAAAGLDDEGIIEALVGAVQAQQSEIGALKPVAKTAEDNWQWGAIALLVLWNIVLTVKRKK